MSSRPGLDRTRANGTAGAETRIIGSGRLGYSGSIMSDLPIPSLTPRSLHQIRELLASAREEFARNGAKTSRSSLLSECSRENIKSIFLARPLWRNPGKSEQKPMPTASEASHCGGKPWETQDRRPWPVSLPFVYGNPVAGGRAPSAESDMTPSARSNAATFFRSLSSSWAARCASRGGS